MIKFLFKGRCQAKERPRSRVIFKNNKPIVITYTPPKTVKYEKKVSELAQKIMDELNLRPFTKNIPLEIIGIIFRAIPKSTSKKQRSLMEAGIVMPVQKPDIDNQTKSVFDALNKIAYEDDSQIVHKDIYKRFDDGKGERVLIIIREFDSINTDWKVLCQLLEENQMR